MPKLLQMRKPAKKQKPKTQYPAPLAPVRSMPDAEEAPELAMVDKWIALADIVLGNASSKRKSA